ncbi:hypothetical protein PHMEG_0003400 [Phytophthora megakarya]|uniref:Uncharacterized protein n=1 Tax=Phytophthora megakarya TaxID=4795 RepID=A0A225WW70_9STRA|nr:hypothetical protein PHMEG_0003400 [Phytophthora megakarya]
MPRPSARQVPLRRLESVVAARQDAAALRYLLGDDDSSEDDMDAHHLAAPREDRWKSMLYDSTLLNETEFLENFRLERGAFFRFVELVKADSVLVTNERCPFRCGAELHMLVLLKCLDSYGNDSTWSKQAQFLSLGKGTNGGYLHRASAALLALESSTLAWPDGSERIQIAFVNCVEKVDVVERDQQNLRECWTRLVTVPRTLTKEVGTPINPCSAELPHLVYPLVGWILLLR